MYGQPQQQPIYAAPQARPQSTGYSPNLSGRHSPNPQPIYGAPRPIDGRYSPNPMQMQGGMLAGGGMSPNLSGRMSPNLTAGGGGGFEVERVSRPPSAMGMGGVAGMAHGGIGGPGYNAEEVYAQNVGRLIAAKTRPFSVSGRIPLDPAHLVLFFRAKVRLIDSLHANSGLREAHRQAHLIPLTSPSTPTTTAHPHSTSSSQHASTTSSPSLLRPTFLSGGLGDAAAVHEAYYFPPNMPLTPSLELANHPLLDAVRAALLPKLPPGTYLTATRDRLDVLLAGGRLPAQPVAAVQAQVAAQGRRGDGRVATLSITLPVRFSGGALTIRDPLDGRTERLENTQSSTQSAPGDLEWTAFLGECEYEVDVVTRGCRMSISYAVFAKPFGPAPGPNAGLASPAPFVSGQQLPGGIDNQSLSTTPLFAPNQPFLDLLPPVLQLSRGRKIAFLLSHDYDVDASSVLAETLVPQLKGGDALLYTALRSAFKLSPALHYTAGGYLWPLDRPVEMFDEDPAQAAAQQSMYAPPPPGAEVLRRKVEASGAVLLAEAGVSLVGPGIRVPSAYAAAASGYGGPSQSMPGAYGAPAYGAPGGMQGGGEEAPVGKTRVHFVANGLLEKLVVNVCVVVYVM
ncbi:hypothetical protein HMN09_01180900 [Mycena chlorophos]|uniref:Uncharacterized protein n=1 Tax=Mycena chlorophos TaxID=658473 RepID=A0A8H6VTY9_MYCCL|nr:hypothetical protein HMN09_01180900 [Mycena chlorophos]